MKYQGNPAVIQSSYKRLSNIVWCSSLIVLMVILFFTNLDTREYRETIRNFSKDLDLDYDVLDSLVRIFMFVMFCFSLAQYILVFSILKTIRSISESYLEIRQSTVIGNAQTTPDNHISLEYVQIPLNQIKSAHSNGATDGFNLIICTAGTEYRFLAIKNALDAAQQINNCVNNPTTTNKPPQIKSYCGKCGAEKSTNASYCETCGASFPSALRSIAENNQPKTIVDTGWECPLCLQQNSRYDMFCKGCASPKQ